MGKILYQERNVFLLSVERPQAAVHLQGKLEATGWGDSLTELQSGWSARTGQWVRSQGCSQWAGGLVRSAKCSAMCSLMGSAGHSTGCQVIMGHCFV